jgi:hypothetical protein
MSKGRCTTLDTATTRDLHEFADYDNESSAATCRVAIETTHVRLESKLDMIGDCALFDHAKFARVGIDKSGKSHQIAIIGSSHLSTSAGMYQRTILAKIAPCPVVHTKSRGTRRMSAMDINPPRLTEISMI